MKVGQPQQTIEVWDAGTYPAEVVDQEDTESTYPGSEGKPRLKWVFRVQGDGEYADIWYWTNATLSKHQAATFRPLVRALRPDLDLDDPDLEIDTRELIGSKCRVILGIDEER